MAVSKRLRFEILRRDSHTCRYCGRSAPEIRITVDHVVPEALGGTDLPDNLVAACGDCNSGKSATPPDAPLVAQVQDDALRWASAVRSVAEEMIADSQAREALRQRFFRAWQGWTAAGRPTELPPNWRESVDSFLAAGLPLPVLIDCVDLAMGRQKVAGQHKFRYMCGIAWKRVAELQEAALQRVRRPAPKDAMRQGNGDEVISVLFGRLPWCDQPDEWPALLAEFDEAHEDYELEDGSNRSFEHWSEFERVFAASVIRTEEMRTQLVMWARDAMRGLPQEVAERLRAEVKSLHAELGDPFGAYLTGDYLTAYAVMIAYFNRSEEVIS